MATNGGNTATRNISSPHQSRALALKFKDDAPASSAHRRVHRTRVADACLFAAGLCFTPPAALPCCPAAQRPLSTSPVPGPTAFSSSLPLRRCKFHSNARYVALPCFAAARIAGLPGRLHSCEPCLDRRAPQRRPIRPCNISASGSSQKTLVLMEGILNVRWPSRPIHATTTAVASLPVTCSQPCHTPSGQPTCLVCICAILATLSSAL